MIVVLKFRKTGFAMYVCDCDLAWEYRIEMIFDSEDENVPLLICTLSTPLSPSAERLLRNCSYVEDYLLFVAWEKFEDKRRDLNEYDGMICTVCLGSGIEDS